MPADEQTGQDAQQQQSAGVMGGTQAANGEQGKIEDLPAWAQTLVKELRDEAAERRVALKKQAEAASAAEQARLAEQGKYKELAEAREKELNATKPYQERAQTLEKLITENNQRIIQQIPEQMRTLVPQLPPEQLAGWLTANQALLTRRPAPDTDAGAGQGGSGGGANALTDDEKAEADKYGVSHEAFAKAKARAKNT
jgi:hypothetical protein